MHPFRRLIAVMLLLLWGTATVHCGLELDGLFGGPSHAGKIAGDNDPEGCGAIENGHFDGSVADIAVIMPLLSVEFVLDAIAVRLESPAELIPSEQSQAPPDLAPRWTFERRTALPVRAPDFVA